MYFFLFLFTLQCGYKKIKNYICDLHCIYIRQHSYIKRQNLTDMSESVINDTKESNLKNIFIEFVSETALMSLISYCFTEKNIYILKDVLLFAEAVITGLIAPTLGA